MTVSQRHAAMLELARERRSITLDRLMTAASKSVVSPVAVADLAREAGLEVCSRRVRPGKISRDLP